MPLNYKENPIKFSNKSQFCQAQLKQASLAKPSLVGYIITIPNTKPATHPHLISTEIQIQEV